MSYFASTKFRKPTKPRPTRQAMKKVGEKGDMWLFVSEVLNLFHLRIGMPRVCQRCHGSSYCGPLQPAHILRRQDIRKENWYYAFRVVPLGNNCHFDVDKKGRRAAEPILEKLRTEALNNLGITEEQAKQIMIECAIEVQQKYFNEDPAKSKYQSYVFDW